MSLAINYNLNDEVSKLVPLWLTTASAIVATIVIVVALGLFLMINVRRVMMKISTCYIRKQFLMYELVDFMERL